MPISNLNLSKTNYSLVTTFGSAYYRPGGICGWRVQQDYQLVVIHKGSAEIQVNEEHPFVVRVGEACLLKPDERELICFDRLTETHHTWVAIHPEGVSDTLRPRLDAAPKSTLTNSPIHKLIELGLADADPVLLDQLGLAALVAYGTPPTKPKSSPLQLAMDYIDTHLGQPLNIAQISAAAFVSQQHLTRIFRSEMGMTPSRYLWDYRTKHGVELLRSTGLTISEISFQLGFQSPFHFSRLVRLQTGTSPTEYRKRVWKSAIERSVGE
jgi:AraC-like DNA-binding protein